MSGHCLAHRPSAHRYTMSPNLCPQASNPKSFVLGLVWLLHILVWVLRHIPCSGTCRVFHVLYFIVGNAWLDPEKKSWGVCFCEDVGLINLLDKKYWISTIQRKRSWFGRSGWFTTRWDFPQMPFLTKLGKSVKGTDEITLHPQWEKNDKCQLCLREHWAVSFCFVFHFDVAAWN